MKTILTLCAVIFSASLSFGAIWMPKVFSDGMMLQRDMPVKVWGTADANAKVEVEFGGKRKSTKADADGEWSLKLDKMPADKNPREMTVYENGKVGKKIGDILVGEVWILGGQSNMEWRLKNTTDAKAAVARADYPTMRYFFQPHWLSEKPSKDSCEGSKWIAAKGDAIDVYSGVGFYFGERLMKDLDVPVGLIYAARGATKMLCWMPEEAMDKDVYTSKYKADFDKKKAAYTPEVYKKKVEEYKAKMAKAKAEDEKLKAEGKPPAKRVWFFSFAPEKTTPLFQWDTPCQFFNAMLSPLKGYTLRGAIWYQGCSDAHKESVESFDNQMCVLVEAWRKNFENKNMPFFQVQLASYVGNQYWPRAREQQLKSAMAMKNGGVANIIDCGEEKDIHPKDKTTVGTRLEKIALRDVYGMKNVQPYGPILKSVIYDGSTATVKFKTGGRGLVGKGEPRGFKVLVGEKWTDAKAEIKGNTVVLKSADGGNIEGVRYLWESWARPNVWLFNKDGLPAFSFSDILKK